MSFMKKQGEAASKSGMTDAKAKARHSWTPKHAKKRYLNADEYLSCLGRIRIVMCGIWMTGAKLEKAT